METWNRFEAFEDFYDVENEISDKAVYILAKNPLAEDLPNFFLANIADIADKDVAVPYNSGFWAPQSDFEAWFVECCSYEVADLYESIIDETLDYDKIFVFLSAKDNGLVSLPYPTKAELVRFLSTDLYCRYSTLEELIDDEEVEEEVFGS